MNYNITIQMSQETLNFLQEQGYTLYGFKGVVSSNPKAKPSVWFTLTPGDGVFKAVTNIAWESPLYIGSCSLSKTPGGPVITGKSPWPSAPGNPVALQKAYTYTDKGWEKNPKDGKPGNFTIYNHVPKGVSNYYVASTFVTKGTESPIIAVEVLPDGGVDFIPVETIAFILAQAKYDAGTLIVQAFSGGCVVTFVGAANNATITYDPQGDGWSAVEVPSPADFQKFPSGTDLYQAMTGASLSAHRALLAPLELYLGSAEGDGPGWCSCDENGVLHNKCNKGYKPKCIDLGKGEWDCKCVQK